MDEDNFKKISHDYELGVHLDRFSIIELEDIIQKLQKEIQRVETEIEKKKRHISAAQNIFKTI